MVLFLFTFRLITMKTATVLFLFIFSIVRITAQEQINEKFHHEVGVAASNISGYGISYLYIFSEDFRTKCTGFYSGEIGYTSSGSNYDYASFGIEGQKTIAAIGSTRIYALLGGGYYYRRIHHYRDDYGTGFITNSTSIKSIYTTGLGVGAELVVIKQIYFSFNLGLLHSFIEYRYQTNKTNNEIPPFRKNSSLGLGIGIGMSYRF